MNRAKHSASKVPNKVTGKQLAPKTIDISMRAYTTLTKPKQRQVDKLLAKLPTGAAESGKEFDIRRYSDLLQLPSWTADVVISMYGAKS